MVPILNIMGLYITIRSNKRLKNNSKDGSYFKYYGLIYYYPLLF